MTGSIDGCMQNIKTTLTECGRQEGTLRSLQLPPCAHRSTDSENFDCCQRTNFSLSFVPSTTNRVTINPIVIISTTSPPLLITPAPQTQVHNIMDSQRNTITKFTT
ncbi:hypothetical protein TcasGA2_TC003622 [Tribolium castaneum]|uniref:Uncharacterized protein n=1 Tax=Tribolium castaneum TaxID=7070 RepID=D6WIC6_TRICA|nr:hypothetical protein TcasGA2_TC003622 [Tribolium castaneum]